MVLQSIHHWACIPHWCKMLKTRSIHWSTLRRLEFPPSSSLPNFWHWISEDMADCPQCQEADTFSQIRHFCVLNRTKQNRPNYLDKGNIHYPCHLPQNPDHFVCHWTVYLPQVSSAWYHINRVTHTKICKCFFNICNGCIFFIHSHEICKLGICH